MVVIKDIEMTVIKAAKYIVCEMGNDAIYWENHYHPIILSKITDKELSQLNHQIYIQRLRLRKFFNYK